MSAHSSKPNTPAPTLTLTASAAALAAAAGSPRVLAQADDAFSLQKTPEPVASGSGVGEALPVDGEVRVDENLIVDLHVVDEDLADVLQMLSIQSQRNIVASRNVSATVTATLYGVTFYEALDAILHVNGFGYVEEGNFIYVYTAEEIQELVAEGRERMTAVIPLDYMNATDAAEFAQALLSESGTIKAPGRTAPFQIPDSAPVGADDLATESFIVVHDFEENIEGIRELLAQIDTKPSQVLVEATILQAAINEANAYGVDFSIIGSLNFGDFMGGPLGAVDNLIAGQGEDVDGNATQVPPGNNNNANAVVSSPGQTSRPGTLKVGVVQGDFAFFLRMLDEVTDTTIIARPKVLTLNRQPARVLVGERVGFLSSTTTETGTTQTVEFLDTGTQLYFRPFVSREGLIRMELKPQVSQAVIRDTTDTTGATVTIPDESTNELTANVMVRDGQTIVLGGLFRESTQYTRRQVPWIADIPVLGIPFKGREDTVDRAEIIFMITPSIINDQIIDEHAERAQALIEGAVAGTRKGLLPFSRDKQASRLLVEAQRYAAEGKTDEAVYCVRRSLSLSPNQPQAHRLLERLTTDVQRWPERSMLEHIYDAELDQAAQAMEDEHEASLEQASEVPADAQPADDAIASEAGEEAGGQTIADTQADADGAATDETVTDDAAADELEADRALAGADQAVGSDAGTDAGADVVADAEGVELADDGDVSAGETTDLADEPSVASPELAQAEAEAAEADSFDEAELADARAPEVAPVADAGEAADDDAPHQADGADAIADAGEPAESTPDAQSPDAESAFEGADWVGSLAEAEIGSALGGDAEPQAGDAADSELADAEQAEADTQPAPRTVVEADGLEISYDARGGTFDLSASGADLGELVRELGRLSRRSVMVSPEVGGTVTATLYGLSLEEVLDAVLGEHGYGYVADGKLLRVRPLEPAGQADAPALAEAGGQAQTEPTSESTTEDTDASAIATDDGQGDGSASDTTADADSVAGGTPVGQTDADTATGTATETDAAADANADPATVTDAGDDQPEAGLVAEPSQDDSATAAGVAADAGEAGPAVPDDSVSPGEHTPSLGPVTEADAIDFSLDDPTLAVEGGEPSASPAPDALNEALSAFEAFAGAFDADGGVDPAAASLESAINEQAGLALLGSLGFMERDWSVTGKRDGYYEPVPWDGGGSAGVGGRGPGAGVKD